MGLSLPLLYSEKIGKRAAMKYGNSPGVQGVYIKAVY
jgi:hypothetical protein